MKLKILSLLVAMLAMVMLLASCGGGGDDKGDGGNDQTSSIIVQLYENDNKGELSSGLKRYYAGKDENAAEPIDDLVRNRNTAAEAAVGNKVTYTYQNQYAWGESFTYIQDLVKSGATNAPDIYCNYAYDLTSLALRNCFANLFTNTVDGLETNGTGNFFRFTEASYNPEVTDYFDSSKSEGYFYEYMKSLSFANSQGKYEKMYCLASDYTIDVVRAFLVMPVNVQLMNAIEIGTGNSYATDRDEDGDFDIDDFYELVWANEWDYNALAAFAKSAQQNADNFALGQDVAGALFGRSSGLTPSGLLYTTNVQIIQRNVNTGSYQYPATNQDLIDFAENLANLFTSEGVKTANTDDMVTAGLVQSTAQQGDLAGIRKAFSNNKVLFGGIIALGSVESAEFQGMNENGGFGIVPVPLYDTAKQTEYLTLVHNIARLAAISRTTTEFADCTKFLNYQSTNSATIIKTYYEKQLVAKVNGLEDNVEMLQYIRGHVRDCFEKTYEDVVSSYMKGNGDENADTNKWHIKFRNAGYVYGNISGDYGSLATSKQGYLVEVIDAWNNLSKPA